MPIPRALEPSPHRNTLSCLPSPWPTQAEGQVCTSALSCPVPFPLHSVCHSRMPSSFPHLQRKTCAGCRDTTTHNHFAGATKWPSVSHSVPPHCPTSPQGAARAGQCHTREPLSSSLAEGRLWGFSHRLPHPWASLCTCHSYHALKWFFRSYIKGKCQPWFLCAHTHLWIMLFI